MTENEKFQFRAAGEQIHKFASKLSEHIAPGLIYEAMFYMATRAKLHYGENKELSIAHLMKVMSYAIESEEDQSFRNSESSQSLSESKVSGNTH